MPKSLHFESFTFGVLWRLSSCLSYLIKKGINNNNNNNKLENLLILRCRERCLHQASKSNFDVAWRLTSWPRQLTFHLLMPWTTCANLQQIQFVHFQNIMFKFFNWWTISQIENVVPPARIKWRRNKKNNTTVLYCTTRGKSRGRQCGGHRHSGAAISEKQQQLMHRPIGQMHPKYRSK